MTKKAESAWMDDVSRLGCIVCRNTGRGETPAMVHHIQDGSTGIAQRASNYETIPLCFYHHQDGPFGEAVHNGTKTFEKNYGTQRELLEQTRREVEELRALMV